MANTHTVETIRQMMKDWNAATEAQRQEALKRAAALAKGEVRKRPNGTCPVDNLRCFSADCPAVCIASQQRDAVSR